MGSLIVFGISISVFLLVLLIGKKKKLSADKFLLLYLLFFVSHQIYFFIESTGVLSASPLMLLGRVFYLLNAPLFFYYVYSLTNEKPFPLRLYIFTLLPFIGYILTFFYYYIQGFDDSISIDNGLLYVNHQLSLVWTAFIILFQLSDPFYLIWFYFILRQYWKRMNDSLSFHERIHLRWLRVLFYIWVFSTALLFTTGIASIGFRWISVEQLQIVLQVVSVLFIFIAGYYGFKQTTVFSDFVPTEPGEEENLSYQRSGLSKDQAILIHTRLLNLMKENKPFLNGELSGRELAQQLGVSMNHLSQVLSQEQKQNFFDFINSYRVKEVQEKMADPKFNHLTLLAIALESGFNSKTSFNTLFKKFTHVTPSQYYQSIKKEQNL